MSKVCICQVTISKHAVEINMPVNYSRSKHSLQDPLISAIHLLCGFCTLGRGSLTHWHIIFREGIKSETSGKFGKMYPHTFYGDGHIPICIWGWAISVLGLDLEEIIMNVDHIIMNVGSTAGKKEKFRTK